MKVSGTPDRHHDHTPAEYWELVHARMRHVHRLHPATASNIVKRHHRLIELCKEEKVCITTTRLLQLEGLDAQLRIDTSGSA